MTFSPSCPMAGACLKTIWKGFFNFRNLIGTLEKRWEGMVRAVGFEPTTPTV
jgi:hypothetical protein